MSFNSTTIHLLPELTPSVNSAVGWNGRCFRTQQESESWQNQTNVRLHLHQNPSHSSDSQKHWQAGRRSKCGNIPVCSRFTCQRTWRHQSWLQRRVVCRELHAAVCSAWQRRWARLSLMFRNCWTVSVCACVWNLIGLSIRAVIV